jgi:hypothetical protein
MASIKAGTYTVDELLSAANFDLSEKAAVDYNPEGVDYRRVKIGGLSFDSTDDVIRVPVTADTVDITVDGSVDTTLKVELDDDQKEERRNSFEVAADASAPKKK